MNLDNILELSVFDLNISIVNRYDRERNNLIQEYYIIVIPL